MADELPEDTQHWPSDPFAVLGVARGASDVEIKRAYTRLIRRFKPEHHPEQFRRIRDAFEICRIQAAWYQSSDSNRQAGPAPTSPDLPVDEPITVDTNHHVLRDTAPSATKPPKRDLTSACWNRLIDGPDPAAYAELVDAAKANPNRVDLLLQLYWILAFYPQLDDELSRHHWLSLALQRSNPHSPAIELYRRELAANPGVALSRPYETLLDSAQDSATLVALVSMRIPAAARGVLWDQMASDLNAASRLRFDNDKEWLNLLVTAHDWAVWMPTSEAYDRIGVEIQELRHLELSQPWAYDRIEEIDSISRSILSMDLPPSVSALMRGIFATRSSPSPSEVVRAASAIVADLMGSWQMFDISNRRPITMMLTRAFEMYLMEFGTEQIEYPAHLIQAAAGRLWREENLSYHRLRSPLLQFLCEERIDPQEFSAAYSESSTESYQLLAKQAGEDVGLRAVWLAFRIVKG